LFFVSLLGLLVLSCGDDETATGSGGAGTAGAGGGASGKGGTGGGSSGTAGAGASGSSGTAGAAGAGGGSGSAGAGGRSGADSGSSGGASGVDGGAGAGGRAGSDAGAQSFPDVLYQGVWFVGWSGGLDHYSWVKFSPSSPGATNGTWAVIDSTCLPCTPYFQCEGNNGLFSATSATRTLVMQYPLACSDSGAPGSETWTVQRILAPAGGPPGAELQLILDVSGRAGIAAYRYSASHCDAGFTSCPGPY